MNKTAIKNFAVWARQKLISDITYKAGMLGITEDGIADKLPHSTSDLEFYDIGTKDYAEVSGKEIKQRNALVNAIRKKEKDNGDYKSAFGYVVEEVAYTWFNRLIAIRFMEVNDYLPSGVRVLSSENKAKKEPDLVTTPFDTDLEFTSYEQDRIIQLKDDNKLDELFRMLFIKQCNKLHDVLPELFEKTDDYTELLLTVSFTDSDGVLYHLVHDIEEVDFRINDEMYTDDGKIKADGQVEIIGWLYQYYNIEPKAAVFGRASGKKISKEEIPAATQLFTPDWIVRYMVENSLGRIWIEGHPDNSLKDTWRYYIDEAEQEPDVVAKLEEIKSTYKELAPESIKIIDPCMGSGHILVYAFDVLMQIYESYGYTQRDAARSILKNNIFGLDIDKRAYQLAYFAVMMKARQYNRRILTENIEPNLCYLKNSIIIENTKLNRLGKAKEIALTLIADNRYAEEYGSALNISVPYCDVLVLEKKLKEISSSEDYSDLVDIMEKKHLVSLLYPIVKQSKILSQKYEVVVTNPPYMAISNSSAKLNEYVKKNYPDSKTDLFAIFIERCIGLLVKNGFQAMITMQSWLFLSSYIELRKKIIKNRITSLLQIGFNSFPELNSQIAHAASFVLCNNDIAKYRGKYFNLNTGKTTDDKCSVFQYKLKNNEYFINKNTEFQDIPNYNFAYWLSNNGKNVLKKSKRMGDCIDIRQGLATGNNNRFLRLWHEVIFEDINDHAISIKDFHNSGKKYAPYNKGGNYRRWYGNIENVIRFDEVNYNLLATVGNHLPSREYYFRRGITWSLIATNSFAARLSQGGFVFDVGGSSGFPEIEWNDYYLGLLCSKVTYSFLQAFNPTINFQVGDIKNIPVIQDIEKKADIDELVEKIVTDEKYDWDSFEISWNFKKHPLISYDTDTLLTAFDKWTQECYKRFERTKENEEEVNRIFIDIYGLQDELTPKVDVKNVTVRKADLQRDIKSLISYAVGCMFGRYSLDVDGLAYAGGEWDESKYKTFIPDADNCIPITDEEYFEDDIVGLFCAWLKKVYGEDTLEENLDFIANALGNKGKTSRKIIRNYFLTDFIKDHIKTYQKRPIYWLFDSGKQNGFKALVYMHRWNADTIGNVRVEYLHRIQRVYEKEITRMQEIIDNSHDNKEISNATKHKEKLQKQIKETKDYDAKIAHLALSRIDIDLDDGVKVNYEKVQTADGKKMQILAKI